MTLSMTKAELLAALRALAKSDDTEGAHGEADDLLVAFIGDPDIQEAYWAVPKWYA